MRTGGRLRKPALVAIFTVPAPLVLVSVTIASAGAAVTLAVSAAQVAPVVAALLLMVLAAAAVVVVADATELSGFDRLAALRLPARRAAWGGWKLGGTGVFVVVFAIDVDSIIVSDGCCD